MPASLNFLANRIADIESSPRLKKDEVLEISVSGTLIVPASASAILYSFSENAFDSSSVDVLYATRSRKLGESSRYVERRSRLSVLDWGVKGILVIGTRCVGNMYDGRLEASDSNMSAASNVTSSVSNGVKAFVLALVGTQNATNLSFDSFIWKRRVTQS
jgi:hypothetical protein